MLIVLMPLSPPALRNLLALQALPALKASRVPFLCVYSEVSATYLIASSRGQRQSRTGVQKKNEIHKSLRKISINDQVIPQKCFATCETGERTKASGTERLLSRNGATPCTPGTGKSLLAAARNKIAA